MDTSPTALKTRTIAKFSKLPQSRPERGGNVQDNAFAVRTNPPVSKLPAGPVRTIPRRPGSVMEPRNDPVSPPPKKRPQSMLMRPGFEVASMLRNGQDNNKNKSIPAVEESDDGDHVEPTAPQPPAMAKTIRRPRPSLSDRTTETLSQVPPTPSPAKRGQASLHPAESPIRPPSRPASSISNPRPVSRAAGSTLPAARGSHRPSSPSKRPPSALDRRETTLAAPIKRPLSTHVPPNTKVNGGSIQAPTRGGMKLQKPGTRKLLGRPTGPAQGPSSGSKGVNAQPTGSRSPVRDPFDMEPSTVQSSAGSSRFKLPPKRGVPTGSGLDSPEDFTVSQILEEIAEPEIEAVDHTSQESPPGKKASAASQSLRDAIAKAKAARRNTSGASVPRLVDDNFSAAAVGGEADPTTFDIADNRYINLLRKRVNSARSDGKLNIAALGLTEIPKEVMTMYGQDPSAAGTAAWYETVDVTRLLAADNEIAELPDIAFPPVDSGSPDTPADGAGIPVFAPLEVIDLHGNLLKAVPPGLGRLQRLTTLNLSRNQLTYAALEIICAIQSLTELRLGENSLQGPLPESIGELENLEILDLHGNAVSGLPPGLGKLSKLKRINVADNRLDALPFEAIFDLPLIEVLASKNMLNGSLLPPNITQIPMLQILDVSNNALTAVTDANVDMPMLQSLNISNNRIAALPDVSTWCRLATLVAEENKISAIPEGFTGLKELRSADLSNNSLLSIEDGVGFMESLSVLRVANNPLRERRYMKLGTEDLKAELRNRSVPAPETPLSPLNPRFSFLLGQQNGVQLPTHQTWTVAAGTLDRSATKLRSVETTDLQPLVSENVSMVILNHNWLQICPPALSLLGSSLTTLDLSHNRLNKTADFFTEPLALPNLQTLNLTSNSLTSLESLRTNLMAPSLTNLILSFNRLTSLPLLRTSFPVLSRLLAPNNALTEIDVDAVRGLQVLDVSSNEINHLPPRLALLQGQLRTLMVGGNRFKVPGWGILEKGTEEILSWCRMKIPAGEEGSMIQKAG